MDERDVEKLLKREVENQIPGARCLKFVSPGYTGVPDRIILLPGGTAVFVELKKPGKEPRQRQLFVQAQFRKLGFPVFGCVDSPEAVRIVVRTLTMLCGNRKNAEKLERLHKSADESAGAYADQPVMMPLA